MSQAVIATSAIEAASQAGPDEIVTFTVALSVPFFTDEELEFLRHEIGMIEFVRTYRLASVGIPAKHLLTLAETAAVIRVG